MQKTMKGSDKMNKTSAWDKVTLARKVSRPKASDYINDLTDEFIQLHGDRLFGDDKSIISGIGKIEDCIVTLIGQQKGKNTKENMECNFGMTNPEGYRKALRLMKQAEKFERPIITFIDTPGAYPGLGAEQRGQRRSNCKKFNGNGKYRSTYNMCCNWRRFKWWSIGIRRCGQNNYVRKCCLFYSFARRICIYFI